MANILAASVPAPGHVIPLLSVAQHLSSLGHSVSFLTGSVFRDQVVARGFRFIPLEGKADFNYLRLDEEMPERAAAKPGPELLNVECISTIVEPMPDQYRILRRLLAQESIDLIVIDPNFMGVMPLLLGPKEARPPIITIGVMALFITSCDVSPFSFPDSSPEGRIRNRQETQQFFALMQPTTARMNHALNSCGAPSLTEPLMDAAAHLTDRFLLLTAEAFEYPRSDITPNIQFIGNLPPAGSKTAALPVWWDSLDRSRPLVLVTQGTLANKDLSQLIEPAIAALADEPVTVLVATGRPDFREVIRFPNGKKPANVIIDEFIPFERILHEIDVFVTNGGYGAIKLALSKGVPLVIAGDTEDKIFNAARVEWSQTGVNLATGRPTAEQIQAAVRQVLTNKLYKTNAVKMQQEFSRYDTHALLTQAVDSLLAQRQQLLATPAHP